jgi:hypothetical protein
MNPNQPSISNNDLSKQVADLVKANMFTARKLCDTPTDALSVVNMKFVTLNGQTASRPKTSILGQFFFDTSLNKPVWLGNSGWVDGVGNPA